MLILTGVRADGKLDLLIVLSDENIDRMKQHDPAELPFSSLPPQLMSLRMHCVGIAYATAEEAATIQGLACEGKMDEAFLMVTKGFRYRPDLGDNDMPAVKLGPGGTTH